MPRDAEFDKLLYGSAGPPKSVVAPAAPATAAASTGTETPAAEGGDQYDMSGRVGRGFAKSYAGTVTGIPRAANAALGLASPTMRESLGNLAERAPGVKRLEEFAASPNETWAETFGYYGGELSQLYGPAEAKWIAKAAEYAPRLIEKLAPRAAERIPGKLDLVSAPAKMKAAEGEVFKPKLDPAGSPYATVARTEDITKRPISGTQRTFAEVAGPSGQRTGTLAAPFTRGERAIEAGKVAAKGAAQGAISGAATDPNDPGAGAALGAATGGFAPLLGIGLQSRVGQWFSEALAREGPYAAISALAGAFGIPVHALWYTGIPEFLIWKHAPGGQQFGQFGRRAGDWLGKLLQRTPGTIPGAAIGSLEDIAEPR